MCDSLRAPALFCDCASRSGHHCNLPYREVLYSGWLTLPVSAAAELLVLSYYPIHNQRHC